MPDFKKVPSWIWATIVGVGTVLGTVTGMITIWNEIEGRTNDAIQTAVTLVTSEIHKQTGVIAEFYEDDLHERIIILETDIDELHQQGKVVPVQKIIQLKAMQERLEEFKQR